MQRLQAFKYELRPDGQQQLRMRRFAGSCRFVFNKALALQQERFEQGEKKLGYAELCKQLTQWKSEDSTAWLAETPSQPLQQTLKDLERAYTNFFAKRADFPRFKRRVYPTASAIRKVSSSIRPIAVCSCLSWVGYATATVGMRSG